MRQLGVAVVARLLFAIVLFFAGIILLSWAISLLSVFAFWSVLGYADVAVTVSLLVIVTASALAKKREIIEVVGPPFLLFLGAHVVFGFSSFMSHLPASGD